MSSIETKRIYYSKFINIKLNNYHLALFLFKYIFLNYAINNHLNIVICLRFYKNNQN